MNKLQAAQKGLEFTGHYDWDKKKIAAIAAEYRAKGYKAYVVTVPKNPLSRSPHGTGWSVYCEPKMRMDEMANNVMRPEVLSVDTRIAAAKAKSADALENTIIGIRKSADNAKNWLLEHGYNPY